MNQRKPFIAGNWKMNLDLTQSVWLVKAITENIRNLEGVDVLVGPPFTSLHAVKEAIADAKIFLAAQNMHWESSGAYTGEVSPSMLIEAGCTHVILGHSERRHLFGETDERIDRKAEAACKVGLTPIVCIGETLEEREKERTEEVIGSQLQGSLRNFCDKGALPCSIVLAYEPVWAIGTGRTATPGQAQEVHHFIRQWLTRHFDAKTAGSVRILYGGSVKPDNIKDLMSMADVDGALVGGASLKADSFIPIIRFGF
jgi:triosephosphate isomerase